jgi:hypothetical protein
MQPSAKNIKPIMMTANLIRHYETDFTIACQCSEAAQAARS